MGATPREAFKFKVQSQIIVTTEGVTGAPEHTWTQGFVPMSPHTNNQYESQIYATNFCLLTLLVNIGKIKVLIQDQNTSKNAKVTLYSQK